MADRVPAQYTRFLNRLIELLPTIAQTRPELAERLQGARLLPSDYQASLNNPHAARLQWSFHHGERDRERKLLSIECEPYGWAEDCKPRVWSAWKASGLKGQVRYNGKGFAFDREWGYGTKEYDNLIAGYLATELQNWALDAMLAAILAVEALQCPQPAAKD